MASEEFKKAAEAAANEAVVDINSKWTTANDLAEARYNEKYGWHVYFNDEDAADQLTYVVDGETRYLHVDNPSNPELIRG